MFHQTVFPWQASKKRANGKYFPLLSLTIKNAPVTLFAWPERVFFRSTVKPLFYPQGRSGFRWRTKS